MFDNTHLHDTFIPELIPSFDAYNSEEQLSPFDRYFNKSGSKTDLLSTDQNYSGPAQKCHSTYGKQEGQKEPSFRPSHLRKRTRKQPEKPSNTGDSYLGNKPKEEIGADLSSVLNWTLKRIDASMGGKRLDGAMNEIKAITHGKRTLPPYDFLFDRLRREPGESRYDLIRQAICLIMREEESYFTDWLNKVKQERRSVRKDTLQRIIQHLQEIFL